MALPYPNGSIRSYDSQTHTHDHAHAQVMVPLAGRMELEIAGRALYTDTSCGVIIPAGASHAYSARAGTRVLVIDAPDQAGLERLRCFAITPACGTLAALADAREQLSLLLALPPALPSRRGLDLARLDQALAQTLHEDWSTARMAALFHLSPQRFHARLVELTGRTPGAWLRERRLERAMRSLRNGMALEAAAAQSGYRSGSALTYALRRDRQTGARALRRLGPL
uniref:helix-turn-helix domain-containing protein n=1 Tax=Castellaniella defragrans TaxID=75697 RepID=UPI003342D592